MKKLLLLIVLISALSIVLTAPVMANVGFGADVTVQVMSSPELEVSSPDFGSASGDLENLTAYGLQGYVTFLDEKLRTGIEVQRMDLSIVESGSYNIGVNGNYVGIFADYKVLSWLSAGLGYGKVDDFVTQKVYLVVDLPKTESTSLFIGYTKMSDSVSMPGPFSPIDLDLSGYVLGLSFKI